MLLRAILVSFCIVTLVSGATGCSRGDGSEPACAPLERNGPARARSMVFILSDTMRRDRVGAYGGPARTPHFDGLARDGLLFTAAATQAPWTKPAVATLFTGLMPASHGVVSHPALRRGTAELDSDLLGAAHETLAESLAAAGYQTAAFVSNPWLRRDLGFDQGFEVWDQSFARNDAPGEVVTSAALRWLRGRAGEERPFFLYLHYMDAHSPYHAVPSAALAARREAIESDRRPVSPGARKGIARMARDPQRRPLAGVPANFALLELVYDLGVEHFDRALGRLLEGLAALPDAADAAILVTSDHGEALLERGWGSHGHGLYENETGIPLAARLPGVSNAGEFGCPVGLVDLRRTVCDYLGVPCEGDDQGTSLFSPTLADPERLVLTESVIGRPRNRAVRTLRHKLLYEPDGRRKAKRTAGRFELYDLVADPAESHDLLAGDAAEAESRAVFERLRAVAEASAAGPRARAERTVLDEATRAQLEALGYLDPAE